MLPGSVTYDGGRVSPVVLEAKSTIALIFNELVGGDISKKMVLNSKTFKDCAISLI